MQNLRCEADHRAIVGRARHVVQQLPAGVLRRRRCRQVFPGIQDVDVGRQARCVLEQLARHPLVQEARFPGVNASWTFNNPVFDPGASCLQEQSVQPLKVEIVVLEAKLEMAPDGVLRPVCGSFGLDTKPVLDHDAWRPTDPGCAPQWLNRAELEVLLQGRKSNQGFVSVTYFWHIRVKYGNFRPQPKKFELEVDCLGGPIRFDPPKISATQPPLGDWI